MTHRLRNTEVAITPRHTHKYRPMNTQTYAHGHTHTYTETYTQKNTHRYMNADTETCTYINTETYMDNWFHRKVTI